VTGLEGSQEAKERLRVVLEVLAGRCRVFEACQQLGISQQRFHQLREEALQGAVSALEARPAGRPRRTAVEEQLGDLQAQVQQQEVEKQLAQTREEVALILGKSEPAESVGEAGTEAKKSARRRKASPVRRRAKRKQ